MSITNKYALVIDDDAFCRNVLLQMLQEHPGLVGWSIIQADDGNEGINVFTEHRPALVLVDRDMPGKTGLDVTRIIKSSVPETRIIGMSGYPDAQQDFEKAGADYFLRKPIFITELLAKVSSLLGL